MLNSLEFWFCCDIEDTAPKLLVGVKLCGGDFNGVFCGDACCTGGLNWVCLLDELCIGGMCDGCWKERF